MYDKQVVRRRRAALAVLVALSLILLTAYFGESPSGVLHGIQRGAQEVLAPIEAGASKALKPFRDLANWTSDVINSKGENERLEDELADARRQLAASQTALRENEQLRAMVDLPRREGFPVDTEPVTARIIARSPTVWYSTIQINKGSSDGIEEDQPVVTGDGLVGKVSAVTGGNATVTLITDASSAVSAQIVPDGASGVVKPAVGDFRDLQLDFVQKGAKIRRGQTIVTSGFRSRRLESLFPKGIPIGRVTRVDADELELYQRVHIEAFADLRRMDYVRVLTAKPKNVEQAQVTAP
jgi:rod shape-determining protein MreC